MSKRICNESRPRPKCLSESDYHKVRTELLRKFGYVKYPNSERKVNQRACGELQTASVGGQKPRNDVGSGGSRDILLPEESIAVGNEHPVATLPVLSAISRVELCIHERLMSPQMKRKSEENLDIPSKQMKSSVSLTSQEKEKAKKTQTKLFAGQDRTLKLISEDCDESLVLRDLSCFTKSQLNDIECQLNSTDEVLLALLFGNNSTQLRDARDRICTASDTKSETVEVTGVGLSICHNSLRQYYLIPMNSKQNPFYEWSKQTLQELMRSPTRKVCYDSQEMMHALVAHYGYTSTEVCSDWLLFDPGVAGWLLDSDHPPQSFKKTISSFTNLKLVTTRGPHTSSQFCSDISLLGPLMFILYRKLESCGLWPLFHDLEMRLCPILAVMEVDGVHVDMDEMTILCDKLKMEISEIERRAHEVVGRPMLLNSPKQLRELLFDELKLDEKLSGRNVVKTITNQEKSTSEAVLNQLREFHPLPGLILQYRHLVKVKSTYFDGLLPYITKGVLHTHWQQTAAATGRLSSANPNIQTIPRLPVEVKNGDFVFPRQPFEARLGYSFLAADFQSIELRLLAHFSEDSNLLHVINTEETTHDVFTRLASQWLTKSLDGIDSADRHKAKRVVYAVVYGVGQDKLSDILGVSLDEAKHVITSFLSKFPGVQKFSQQCINGCKANGFVSTIFRRRRLIPLINSDNFSLRNQAARQAVNFVVQGSAADLCKAAMIQTVHNFTKVGIDGRLLIQIHDELLFEVKDEELTQATWFGVLWSQLMVCVAIW
ncbi:DNA polymerase nu-like isoform X2 [Corticium candelabrum]|uniref:DNA polymerase nu-like isoform X2 n=1 Tax=Corticium candelabrum TaxID=121492 RepID=UPI002E263AF3|nr:DNA polymerase nu-like isoform X2 [Corticium candelabrum]